jgi:hypothetical protein
VKQEPQRVTAGIPVLQAGEKSIILLNASDISIGVGTARLKDGRV